METHRYRDFDAFAAAVRDVDSDMMLQNPSRRMWSICHVNLSGLHFQLGKLGSGSIVEGRARTDGYLLYLPLTEAAAYLANGTELEKDSFAVLTPGRDFCISTNAEHDWCTVFVPKQEFAHNGERVDLPVGSSEITVRVSRADRQATNLFRTIVHQIIDSAHHPQFERSPLATGAAITLANIASRVIAEQPTGTPSPAGRPRIPRQEIIRRSKQLLEERDGGHVSVEDLAVAAEASERTLRTAFKEYFGVGPVRYLHLRQLHQVHRILRTADPGAVSVSEVLFAHGVDNLGRFASRYHQLFGELPSDTLRDTRVGY